MKKGKILSKKEGISYLEILILIIYTFAFSYIVYQPMKSVSAQESDIVLWTCKETKDEYGSKKCQEYLSSECNEKCKSDCFPGTRDEFSECQLGCCIDSIGKCMSKVPKAECIDKGGKWENDANCNPGKIPQCKLGCCVLNNNVKPLVTEKECRYYTSEAGINLDSGFDFRQGMNEPECLALALTQAKGACVIGESCRFVSEQECYSLTNSLANFHKDWLCTHPELNNSCNMTEETTCVDGRDGVYFVDSCGNIANIYDASKVNDVNYWKEIIPVSESCGSNDEKGNANSKTCGNCNRFLGSSCSLASETSPEYGNYICKPLDCPNAPDTKGTKDRKNGESWCVYESVIGEGRDVVGSRHYRYSCVEGEVKIEPCADFRNEICVESEVGIAEGGSETFSTASCRLNRWQECLNYNNAEGNTRKEKTENMKAACSKNEDCFVKEIKIDSKFSFSVCVPNYPPGFDLSGESNVGSDKVAEEICNMADNKCTVVYVKDWKGSWDCKVNCNCEKPVFTNQMNEFCSSLGDCGGYVNVEGEFTDEGYEVKGKAPKKLSSKILNEILSYSSPDNNQAAEPGDMSKYYGNLSILSKGVGNVDYDNKADLGWVGYVAGAAGTVYAVAAAYVFIEGVDISLGAFLEEAPYAFGDLFGSAAPIMRAFARVAIGAAIGAVVGQLVGKAIGAEGEGAAAIAYAGAVGGIFIGIAWESARLTWEFGLIGVIIFVVVLLWTWITGWGDVRERVVSFNCEPWQPPVGGSDCEKCNKDEQGCSKYKCESLGTACRFLNEGTTEETCIASENDKTPPEISQWNEILSDGYKYEKTSDGIKIRQNNGECIPEFSQVNFGLITNERAQCKYELEASANYDLMENYFGESNLYLINHSMSLSMPSVDSIVNQYNVTKEFVEEKYGDFKLYVRCRDDWNNFNIKEYVIDLCVKPGPDITPPIIQKIVPETESYLAYNETEKNIKVYTNEPSSCKYSSQDKEYEAMENSMSCNIKLQDQEQYGWPCSVTLTNLTKQENKIFIRCKDKPWLEENNETRKANSESYEYNLIASKNKLEIISITPNKTLEFGDEPVSIELKAQTSGGAEQGKSECYFSFLGEEGSYILFKNTFSSSHSQLFNQMLRGTHKIYVKCEDIAGNVAEDFTRFKLKIDTTPPRIVRAYNFGQLKIITNEDSECVYSHENCNFVWENATEMSGIQKIHETSWKQGKTYYVKCKDLWDNKPGGCSIIIKAV